VPYYIPIAFGLSREGLSSLAQDLKYTLILAAIVSLLLAMRWIFGWGLPFRGMF
jgi:hypothetical protein